MNPEAQKHVAVWALTSHTALLAQGLAAMQGLIQALFWQISLSEHSELELQPEGGGGASNRLDISFYDNNKHRQKLFIMICQIFDMLYMVRQLKWPLVYTEMV